MTGIAADLARLPEPVRRFIEAERAAGNAVVAVLPPPAGTVASIYVILARPVTTQPRDSAPHWGFGERAPGVPAVVIVESEPVESDPPHAPGPAAPEPPPGVRRHARASRRVPDPAGRIERLRASMVMDFDRWRDGTGYDLAAIDEATPEERAAMLQIVLAQGVHELRDVEAVARLGGPDAEEVLRQHFRFGGLLHRLAVLREAPGLVTDDERTATLVQALGRVRPFEGLSLTLDLVAQWHPPAVMEALWQAACHGLPERAVHAAALLAWLHGLAAEPFDWSQRPFFLQFGDADAAVRAQACRVLRERVRLAGGHNSE